MLCFSCINCPPSLKILKLIILIGIFFNFVHLLLLQFVDIIFSSNFWRTMYKMKIPYFSYSVFMSVFSFFLVCDQLMDVVFKYLKDSGSLRMFHQKILSICKEFRRASLKVIINLIAHPNIAKFIKQYFNQVFYL